MNKVWVLPPSEDWIVDRFVKEWAEDNADITVSNPTNADVIWLLADWAWRRLPPSLLASKKVLATVHHIVPAKFGWLERQEWDYRDRFITAYQVYNQHTFDFIAPMTQKPIHLVKYWANQKIWKRDGHQFELRKKYGLPSNAYLIGSFQRDTEGNDLKSPKLEKGPDLLADFLIKLHQNAEEARRTGWYDDRLGASQGWPCHVVLAGWRRQYIIGRLEVAGVPYAYFERPSQEVINELYQTLDLYPVTAREEGGPQSLIECGLLSVPVVSRPVGIAEQVLPVSAINDDVFLAKPEIPNVEEWKLPGGYQAYRDLIQSL